jgi:hypothetical protein
MKPTNKLRFVERDSYSRNGEHFATPHKVRILQQWWEWETCEEHERQPYNTPFCEWRDVPVEKE